MNQNSSGFMSSIPVVTRNLLIINILVWLAQFLLGRVIEIDKYLALHFFESDLFMPHQIITYMFLHDPSSPAHLFFNMFAVYMFGRTLEMVWGPKRFLVYYLLTGIGAAVASIALGATVIEKHFTIARADGGVDSAFSLEPMEMKQLVEEANRAYQAIGQVHYGISEQEKKSLQFRRSLYIVEDMKAGDLITKENMRAIRPGLGLAPKYYDLMLGKRVKCDILKGTALDWNLI